MFAALIETFTLENALARASSALFGGVAYVQPTRYDAKKRRQEPLTVSAEAVKMVFRLFNTVLAIAAATLSSVNSAQDDPTNTGTIVVVGSRAEQAEIAASQATAITLRPPRR